MRVISRLLILGFLLGVAGISCNSSPAPSGETRGLENQPIQLLVRRLHNQGYTRSLDNNAYELTYRAVPPKTVVVILKTTSKADPNVIRNVSSSVVDLIKRVGKTEFGLDEVDVEIERSSLDQ